ncbi:MAG: DNA polymerase III subunit delta [Clostridium sp.]
MVNLDLVLKELKSGKEKNSYILCGPDEELIKEGIDKITKRYVSSEEDLNFTKFDGIKCEFDEVKNACETFPFMAEKKVVVIYRCSFLKEKVDSNRKSFYKEMKEYLKDIPSTTVLIMYYVFNDKRENAKKNKSIMGLDKATTIVQVDKLKRDGFYKRLQGLFKEYGGEISTINLKYYAEKIPMNMEIAKKEVSKIVDYTNGREIKREDIDKMVLNNDDDDVFDLVDFIGQKKTEKAIKIVNELLFKADQHMLILISIQNQIKKLYDYKLLLKEGKSIDNIQSITRLPMFVVEKMVNQSKKFSFNQLKESMKLCIETEKTLKSTSRDKKMELELLILNMALIKK